MKKCVFCAEEIQDDAIKCRYCNEFLDGRVPVPSAPDPAVLSASPAKVPWYCNTASLVIGFFCVGPLVLPLVWMNPRYSSMVKIVVTVLMAGITVVLIKATAHSLGELDKYYQMLPK